MRQMLALALLVIGCSGRSGASTTAPHAGPDCKVIEADRAACLGQAGYQYVADPMSTCGGGTPKEHEPDPSPPTRPCECFSPEDLAERDEQCKNMPGTSEP